MLNNIRNSLSSCHPERARPTKEGGRSRRIPICFLCYAASGSSHENLLNSVASFAVQFQISLAGSSRQAILLTPRSSACIFCRSRTDNVHSFRFSWHGEWWKRKDCCLVVVRS